MNSVMIMHSERMEAKKGYSRILCIEDSRRCDCTVTKNRLVMMGTVRKKHKKL